MMISDQSVGKIERLILFFTLIYSLFLFFFIVSYDFEYLYDEMLILSDLEKIQSFKDFILAYKNFGIQDFQPLRDLFLKLNVFLSNATSFWKLHYGNLFLWCMVTGAFYHLIKKMTKYYDLKYSSKFLLAISLIFIFLNPIFHSAIGVVVNIKHSLAALFLFISLSVVFQKEMSSKDLKLFFLFFLLSLLSNLISILFLLPLLFRQLRNNRKFLFDNKKSVIVFGILTFLIVFMNWRYYSIGFEHRMGTSYTATGEFTLINYLDLKFQLYGRQFFQLVFPFSPQMLDKKLDHFYNYIGLILLCMYTFFTSFSYRQSFKYLVSFSLFPLLLVNLPLSYSFAIDTYLYTLGIGFYLSILFIPHRIVAYGLMVVVLAASFTVSIPYIASFQNKTYATNYCMEREPSFSCVVLAVSHSYSTKNYQQCLRSIESLSQKEIEYFRLKNLVLGVYYPYCLVQVENLANEVKVNKLKNNQYRTIHSEFMLAKLLKSMNGSEWFEVASAAFQYPGVKTTVRPKIDELILWYAKECPKDKRVICEQVLDSYTQKK